MTVNVNYYPGNKVVEAMLVSVNIRLNELKLQVSTEFNGETPVHKGLDT